MTSTEHISDLIDSYTDLKSYFEGIRGRIDADLSTAERRVGDSYRRFWVDQANGDDNADGSQGAPLQTIEEAKRRSAWGGFLWIDLMSDYHVDQSIHFRSGGVSFVSDVEYVSRRITFADHLSNDGRTNPRFEFPYTGGGFHFRDITLVSRKMLAEVTRPHMIASHGLTATAFNRCAFEVPDRANLPVFQQAHGLGFIVSNSIYPPEMAGLWIEGVAAGTDPATISRLAFTNLTSL